MKGKFIVSLVLLFCTATIGQAETPMQELNRQRAQRGLPPYKEDPKLTEAAQRAADYRAKYLMFGHTSNDFQFLEPGITAQASGCAAYPKAYGFMACACYEHYRYAGAAVSYGKDGKRYCHLFVR